MRHLVRSVGSVRRRWRPVVGTFRGIGGNQKVCYNNSLSFRDILILGKRQQHTQESSFNRERSLDPLAYDDIDSEIRSGPANTPEPSSLQKPESELPINNAKLGDQDSGLPDLSPQEEAIFNWRLLKIWEGLMLSMNADWKDKVSRLPSGVWLSRIAEHIPTDVKLLLVSPQPPSLTRLNSLPGSETTGSGVFAWCFKPNGKQTSVRNTDYLFIDSASRYSGGLRTRRRRLLFSIA